MIHAQTLDFVKWNEHSGKEQLMLLLQRECKPVDDRTQNLE